jgi:hypothetical protein
MHTLNSVRPLADPLRVVRRFFGRLIVFGTIFSIVAMGLGFWVETVQQEQRAEQRKREADKPLWQQFQEDRRFGPQQPEHGSEIDWPFVLVVPAFAFLVGGLPMLLFIWSLLPNRDTNALYLRSFSNDRQSWPVRKAAQSALGRTFRLSGIRDPRRRLSFLDYVSLTLFLLRYCTPKFMNLEAGQDWHARLWRSLADVRCALIELSDLTPSVRAEIKLCVGCIGPERILFVGDSEHSRDEWRDCVKALWPTDQPLSDQINMAVFDPTTSKSRQAFKTDVRAFASGLPKQPAGIKTDTFPSAQIDTTEPATATVHDWESFALMFVASIAIGLGVSIARAASPSLGAFIGTTWSVIVYSTIAWFLLGYMINATAWARARTLVCLVVLAAWYLNSEAAFHAVRAGGQRMQCRNHLNQIGLAILNYEDDHHQPPPAYVVDVDGKPMHSWRVLLLPYLGPECKALYDRYRLDEPWNGPHNKELAKSVPEVYRCPSDQRLPEGCTSYFLVVGEGLAYQTIADTPERQEIRRSRPNDWDDQSHIGAGGDAVISGRHRAIMVESSRMNVNWLEPRDLPREALLNPINSEGVETLSSSSHGGVICLMEFGASKFIPQGTDPLKVLEYFEKSADTPTDAHD